MDKKQLTIEYMSILTESHPGLTFEEYRDCCVFILFYNYCCLRYGDLLEDRYKLKELVRLAIRGKLQIPSFLKFMEAAASFLHLQGCPFRLTELSFGGRLYEMHSQEKQKSLARFIRKLIKKIDAWDCEQLLFEQYADLFAGLMQGFARARKETHLSEELLSLYQLFFDNSDGSDNSLNAGNAGNLDKEEEAEKTERTERTKRTDRTDRSEASERTIFVPEFRYGLLFETMKAEGESYRIIGYDSEDEYAEIYRILCFMRQIPEECCSICGRREWRDLQVPFGSIDRIAVFLPNGPDGKDLITDPDSLPWDKDLFSSRTKGELPFVLSALPYLKENGCMTAVFPSALLYREGKETQIRRYLIEELNCLDTVVLLPDSLFVSAGQQEVLLYFKMGRTRKDIMFFDCSDISRFGQEDLEELGRGIKNRENVKGYSIGVSPEDISANDYNLNLPRYISKTEEEAIPDLDARRARIMEIDRELAEIDEKIAMYKRALEL